MCLYLHRVLAMAAKRGPVMCCARDRSAGPFQHDQNQMLTDWKPSKWAVPWRPWSSQTAKEPAEDKLEQSSQTEDLGDLTVTRTRLSGSFVSCSISESIEYSSEAAGSDPPATDPPLSQTATPDVTDSNSSSSRSSSGNLQNLSVVPSRPKISGGSVRGPR